MDIGAQTGVIDTKTCMVGEVDHLFSGETYGIFGSKVCGISVVPHCIDNIIGCCVTVSDTNG